jgi:hypothetical protein
MSYLKDREIWLSSVPTGNPPAGYVWVFIQNGVFVVRDSNGVDKIMATTTGTVTNATSASYVEYSNVANKPALISGSSQVSYTGLSNVPAGIVSGSAQVSFNGIVDKPTLVSSSAQIGEYGVFATTGSNQFNGSQAVTGSLTVTGQVVAQTLNVQQVTSSIVYSSGSNIFGNSLGNTQQFTGSVSVTGSLTSNGALSGTSAAFSSGATFGSTVRPITNFAADLGTSTFRWAEMFGYSINLTNNATISGTLGVTGSATFASSITSDDLILTAGTLFGAGNTGFSNRLSDTTLYLQMPATGFNITDNALNTRFILTSAGAATFSSSVTANGLTLLNSSGTYLNYYVSTYLIGRIGNTDTNDMYYDSTFGGNHYFRTGTGGTTTPTTKFTILQAGNVGIGTTSPNTKLQIEDGFISTYHNINTNGAGYGVQFYTNGGGSKNTIAAIEISQDGTARSGNMIFSTSNAGAPTERMRITLGGGMSYLGPYISMDGSGAGSFASPPSGLGYGLFPHSGVGLGISSVVGTSFWTGGTPVERMRITTNGRTLLLGSSSSPYENSTRALLELNHTGSSLLGLRIGGSERAYLYHNNSHLYIEQMLAGASIYVISVSAGVYLTAGGTSWTSNSDERLKNINGSIENAVDKLMTLRTVNYSWKNDQNQKQNLGLIAQDVEKVFPQVIDLNKLPSKPNQEQEDNTEYLGVRYQELIPVLVKAIQELKSENDNLKSRLEVLEQS